jgi:hypothetical protein
MVLVVLNKFSIVHMKFVIAEKFRVVTYSYSFYMCVTAFFYIWIDPKCSIAALFICEMILIAA